MGRRKINLLNTRFWPRRLANQNAVLTIILFSLGIVFFSVHVARENAEFTIKQIQLSGEALAKNISVTGSAYLFSTYYGPLEELLVQAANFPNVDELEILDTEGMVIREAKRMDDGRIKILKKKHHYNVPSYIASGSIEMQKEHVVIWQPIVSGILQGWVRVEMGLANLHRKQSSVYRNIFTLGGGVLLIILASKLLYMRRPMQVLATLTSFASRLIDKHGETIKVSKSSEELDRLATALNKVSVELQQQDIDIKTALQSLELQKTALDLHSIVSITDVRGNITYANEKFCEVSGYSNSELVGQNHRIVKSNVHGRDFHANLWQTISSGRVWKGEICNQAKNGQSYWVETTIVPFIDDNNKPYQYVAIRTEITSLKNLAEKLIDSQERLQQSQAFARMGNWEWNIKSGNIIWSSQIPLMFGLDESTQSTTFDEFIRLVASEDRDTVLQSIGECLHNSAEYDVAHRVVWPDGSVRWLHEKGNVVRDEEGCPARMLGVVQDVTERKEAEKTLQELEAHMRQSQKMEAIGTMAGGIAHDFNNILTSIIGYTELNIVDMKQGTEAWEIQNEILTASNRAKEVVNQILLFSRKDSEDAKVIKPGYIVDEAVRLLKTLIGKNIQLQCGEIDRYISINISATQLHQAIINLTVNASHAIAENEKGVISISLTKKAVAKDILAVGGIIPPGEYARLEISDTGCGITQEHLAHIFEPFYTTKSIGKGTGMGLSVVYGVVNKAQGAIVVNSEPGKGTVFGLYFPIVAATIKHTCKEA